MPVDLAAVSFDATATFTAEPIPPTPPPTAVPGGGSVTFAATGTLDVVARPVGHRRRLVVVDIDGNPYGELENASVGSVTYTLNEPETFDFALPLTDPKAHLILDEKYREVQLWRGDQLLAWGPMVRPSANKTTLAVSVTGVLWYLTRRHVGRASRHNYVVNGDFEDGTTGWEVGALNPLEAVANRDPAHYRVATPTDRSLTGRHALALEQLASGTPRYGVSASQFFVWDVDPTATPEGDQWTFVARCYIPSGTFRGPPPDGIGIALSRFSTARTVVIAPEDGGAPVAYPAPIETVVANIDENTPRDIWTPLEVTLLSPVTGEPEFVQVAVFAPDGAILFDRVALSLDEGLRWFGADQATIAAGLLDHLQDPEFGKSPLNLFADMAPTGVLRDRTYLFHEHVNGADALDEFTTLSNGMDYTVALTATTRTVRSHHPGAGTHRPAYRLELGTNLADYAWTFDGESAANHVVVLGTGNGSDREETSATNPSAFAQSLTLETVYTAPPETPIDSLDEVGEETLAVAATPEVLTVTTLPPTGNQPDPVGVLAPGDTVPVSIRTGPLHIEGTYRIVSLTITPDDTLELTLNRRDP